ncbi:hypothetical protein GF339_19110 [candidate division KSB3 bacterium]|uniref:AroM protein n=1 Tax=candidate division KSB3 bacterium TaxID=2044937 RepID=A0A9D5JYP2_9BACT|nr:hypothetical protein [candidate division KSB3 bacterium]MBD3326702.1 hypothetical protein [candidate division KSB3 bacterium]
MQKIHCELPDAPATNRKQRKPRIGMISIGQSPRPDILSIFHDNWGDRAEMIEAGALDGVTEPEVIQMTPQKGDDVLVIKMADGHQHLVGRRYLIPRIQHCVDTLMIQKPTAFILLCTGDFRPFYAPVPFIIPQRIVDHTIAAFVSPGQMVGVMIPTGAQQKQMRRKLARYGVVPVFASASPHTGEQEITAAAYELRRHDLTLIVMHCFGYTRRMRQIVQEILGKPTLLSNMLVAKVTGEVLL